jgi:hypothetical protein
MSVSGEPLDGVDVHFLDGDLVVSREVYPRWAQPADTWDFDEISYDVFGFSGPQVQDDGRQLFQVFVHRRPLAD